MAYLWKVTAKRNNGKVTKGMSVEIYKKGTNAKPNMEEIADALNDKYNENIPKSACGLYNFDVELIK